MHLTKKWCSGKKVWIFQRQILKLIPQSLMCGYKHFGYLLFRPGEGLIKGSEKHCKNKHIF